MANTDRLKKKIGKGRHLSAFKRQRQNEKRQARNKKLRTSLKTAIKKLRTSSKKEELPTTISTISKMAAKGIIPKKRASRLTSRLTKLVATSALTI